MKSIEFIEIKPTSHTNVVSNFLIPYPIENHEISRIYLQFMTSALKTAPSEPGAYINYLPFFVITKIEVDLKMYIRSLSHLDLFYVRDQPHRNEIKQLFWEYLSLQERRIKAESVYIIYQELPIDLSNCILNACHVVDNIPITIYWRPINELVDEQGTLPALITTPSLFFQDITY